MAVQFHQPDTSVGPLDVAKPSATPTDFDLEPNADPESAQEVERARNPLGYTVTSATESQSSGRSEVFDPYSNSADNRNPDIDEDEVVDREVIKAHS